MNNFEKIAVNGHYVWVDKEAEITGDYIGWIGQTPYINPKEKSVLNYKIIAASTELNLEGVPTYFEWLSIQEYPVIENAHPNINWDLLNKQEGFEKGYQTAEKEILQAGYIIKKGDEINSFLSPILRTLNQEQIEILRDNLIARTSKLPTWDDVRKAIELARLIKDNSCDDIFDVESISGLTEICTYGWREKHTTEEIIEQLKQEKKS